MGFEEGFQDKARQIYLDYLEQRRLLLKKENSMTDDWDIILNSCKSFNAFRLLNFGAYYPIVRY